MASLLWISALLVLQGCHSYILLTANLDDVHTIAKQIIESPIAGHINKIIRRASTIFNQHYRAGNDDDSPHYPRADSSSEPVQDDRSDRRQGSQVPRDYNHHRRSQIGETSGNKDSQINSTDQHVESTQAHVTPTGHVESGQPEIPRERNQTDELEGSQTTKPRDDRPGQNTRRRADEVVALGKNVSFYLNAIKKIIENNRN